MKLTEFIPVFGFTKVKVNAASDFLSSSLLWSPNVNMDLVNLHPEFCDGSLVLSLAVKEDLEKLILYSLNE